MLVTAAMAGFAGCTYADEVEPPGADGTGADGGGDEDGVSGGNATPTDEPSTPTPEPVEGRFPTHQYDAANTGYLPDVTGPREGIRRYARGRQAASGSGANRRHVGRDPRRRVAHLP